MSASANTPIARAKNSKPPPSGAKMTPTARHTATDSTRTNDLATQAGRATLAELNFFIAMTGPGSIHWYNKQLNRKVPAYKTEQVKQAAILSANVFATAIQFCNMSAEERETHPLFSQEALDRVADMARTQVDSSNSLHSTTGTDLLRTMTGMYGAVEVAYQPSAKDAGQITTSPTFSAQLNEAVKMIAFLTGDGIDRKNHIWMHGFKTFEAMVASETVWDEQADEETSANMLVLLYVACFYLNQQFQRFLLGVNFRQIVSKLVKSNPVPESLQARIESDLYGQSGESDDSKDESDDSEDESEDDSTSGGEDDAL